MNVTLSEDVFIHGYTAVARTLTVNKIGDGTVTPDVGPHVYPNGREVTLSASPAPGCRFWLLWPGLLTQPLLQPTVSTIQPYTCSISTGASITIYTLRCVRQCNDSPLIYGEATYEDQNHTHRRLCRLRRPDGLRDSTNIGKDIFACRVYALPASQRLCANSLPDPPLNRQITPMRRALAAQRTAVGCAATPCIVKSYTGPLQGKWDRARLPLPREVHRRRKC